MIAWRIIQGTGYDYYRIIDFLNRSQVLFGLTDTNLKSTKKTVPKIWFNTKSRQFLILYNVFHYVHRKSLH